MAKAPIDIRSLARSYAPMAIRTLAGIARNCTEFPHAQVAAANALLDRGYGRPQGDHDGGESITITIRKILEGGAITVAETKVIEHEASNGDARQDRNGDDEPR